VPTFAWSTVVAGLAAGAAPGIAPDAVPGVAPEAVPGVEPPGALKDGELADGACAASGETPWLSPLHASSDAGFGDAAAPAGAAEPQADNPKATATIKAVQPATTPLARLGASTLTPSDREPLLVVMPSWRRGRAAPVL